MHTTVAWLESVDAAGAFVDLNAIADAHIFRSGDDIRIPELTALIAAAAGIGSGGNGVARLEAPSLLNRSRLYLGPVNGLNDGDVEPSSPHRIQDYRFNPVVLAQDENVKAQIHTNTTAAAIQWVLAWLSDGPVQPVAGGEMFTIRATGTTTLTASAWTQGEVTFDENLPVGTYQVVGLRAQSAGLIAARLVFRGGLWRPGCLGNDDESDLESPLFRSGNLGVWGEFHSTRPPAFEALSISADTAEEFLFDLVPVG